MIFNFYMKYNYFFAKNGIVAISQLVQDEPDFNPQNYFKLSQHLNEEIERGGVFDITGDIDFLPPYFDCEY